MPTRLRAYNTNVPISAKRGRPGTTAANGIRQFIGWKDMSTCMRVHLLDSVDISVGPNMIDYSDYSFFCSSRVSLK